MSEKKVSFLYRIIVFLVRLFSPKFRLLGTGNIPDEPCILVGNHSQMYGPIACEIYPPVRRCTWCAGEMMHRKEVPAYAYKDFWSFKPKYVRWFYKILSYVITPLCVCVFNNAECVPVYRDSRIITTFRESLKKLAEGCSLVIFPEYNRKYNNIIYDFHDKFIDLARFYYKKTGIALSFVPMYIAPNLKTVFYGKPIRFDPSAPIEAERQRIKDYLMREITNIAVGLPEHTVVPYRNIRKKDYPKNNPLEVYDI